MSTKIRKGTKVEWVDGKEGQHQDIDYGIVVKKYVARPDLTALTDAWMVEWPKFRVGDRPRGVPTWIQDGFTTEIMQWDEESQRLVGISQFGRLTFARIV